MNTQYWLLQLCPTLCDPTNCSPPGSSVHEILQARILEWVATASSRGSSQPRDQIHVSYVSCLCTWVLYHENHLGSSSMITWLYKEYKFSWPGPLYSLISFNGTSRDSTLKTISVFPVTREPSHHLWLGALLLVVPWPDHSTHHSHLPKSLLLSLKLMIADSGNFCQSFQVGVTS